MSCRSAWSVVAVKRARSRDPGLLVLEQLADVREREPGIVTKPADEAQALQVLGVIEAVGTLRARRRGEQAEAPRSSGWPAR